MKSQFGSRLSRIIGRGSTLSPLEIAVLHALVAALPGSLRVVVEAQFNAYNLVQREVDGRALNFYCESRDAKTLPLFAHKRETLPLVRITAATVSANEPLHAVLSAVNGRAFCVSFNRKPAPFEHRGVVKFEHVVEAWRGNVYLELTDA